MIELSLHAEGAEVEKSSPARLCGCGLTKAHHGCTRRTLVTQAGEFTVSRIELK